MIIIGIDPGLDGGIAILDSRATPIVEIMPTLGTGRREIDVGRLVERFSYFVDPHHAMIERQQAMPKQGVASTFRTGENYGLLIGILAGLQIPYTIVPPRTWQKVMLDGVGKIRETPKAASIFRAQQLFPNVNLKATDRCRKCHDGMAEALLIAAYGERILRTIER